MLIKSQNRKSIIAILIIAGVLLFSTGHTMAMTQPMDSMSCALEKMCGACTVPVTPDFPEVSYALYLEEVISFPPAVLPDLHPDRLYHPPR